VPSEAEQLVQAAYGKVTARRGVTSPAASVPYDELVREVAAELWLLIWQVSADMAAGSGRSRHLQLVSGEGADPSPGNET
jgi:hypothetical protein